MWQPRPRQALTVFRLCPDLCSPVSFHFQDKRAVERLEVEKAFHPFIAGPYNRLVSEIMQETGTRINIPPPSVNRTEIVFTGEKEQLAQAVARIKKIYEEKVAVGGGKFPWSGMESGLSSC